MMIKVLTLLSAIVLVSSSSEFTPILNKLVDDVIEIIKTGTPHETILPHVSLPYTYKWLLFSKSGTIDCKNGLFTDLYTMKRTENVTFSIKEPENIMKLKTAVGVTKFDFSFESCTIDWIMVPRGPINGSVGTNSIELEFSLKTLQSYPNITSKSVLSIDSINLNRYEDVNIELVGTGGVLHWIEQKILNMVATGESARKMFNNAIENDIRQRIPNIEIDIKPIIQLPQP